MIMIMKAFAYDCSNL